MAERKLSRTSGFASTTDRLVYEVSGQFRVVFERSALLCCCSEQNFNLCSSVSDSKPASEEVFFEESYIGRGHNSTRFLLLLERQTCPLLAKSCTFTAG